MTGTANNRPGQRRAGKSVYRAPTRYCAGALMLPDGETVPQTVVHRGGEFMDSSRINGSRGTRLA